MNEWNIIIPIKTNEDAGDKQKYLLYFAILCHCLSFT